MDKLSIEIKNVNISIDPNAKVIITKREDKKVSNTKEQKQDK